MVAHSYMNYWWKWFFVEIGNDGHDALSSSRKCTRAIFFNAPRYAPPLHWFNAFADVVKIWVSRKWLHLSGFLVFCLSFDLFLPTSPSADLSTLLCHPHLNCNRNRPANAIAFQFNSDVVNAFIHCCIKLRAAKGGDYAKGRASKGQEVPAYECM